MSIEIFAQGIIINSDENRNTAVDILPKGESEIVFDTYDGFCTLSKFQLAQLIIALQAMHDKMIDNNEGE